MPYVAYDAEMEMYLNSDESVGFAWECHLRVDPDKTTNEPLKQLSSFKMPEGSVLQFMLCADPDYLFIVSVKFEVDKKIEVKEALDIRDLVFNELKIIGLNPQPQTPQGFIDFTRKLFTGNDEKKTYNDDKPIKKQCLSPKTKIELNWNELKFNERILNCLTLRMVPEGAESATVQDIIKYFFEFFKTPEKQSASCFYTLNIVFNQKPEKPESEISKKIKKFAPGFLMPGQDENEKKFTVLPTFWLISGSESSSIINLKSLKQTMEQRGFAAHEEKEILTPLFIASMPFGLYTTQNTFKSLNRGFALSWDQAVNFLPLQVTKNGK
jgi:conjugal transfer ATP-binding protein TraC